MNRKLTVEAISGTQYRVTVEEDASRTVHQVTVADSDLARYAPGGTPENLLEASFQFLLEREAKESILPRFALPDIERYFPEYAKKIRQKF